MKRVLVITPGVLPVPPYLGGAVENLVYNLHHCLRQEYEFSYVSVRPPQCAANGAYEMPGARFVYVDSINPLEDFSVANDFELSESSKTRDYEDHCRRVLQEERFDIIHIHNEAFLVQLARSHTADARIVLHVNDEMVTRMTREQLVGLRDSVDEIVACSGYIQQAITNAYQDAGVAAPRLRVIYNGVRTDVYDPDALDPRRLDDLRAALQLPAGKVVLFVGRMIEQKGPHLALRAVRRVADDLRDVTLLFVGAPWYSWVNQSPFVAYLKAEAADLITRLRFTGYVDQKEIPYYYGLADVTVCPSIWDDPSPFVAYEAQAMGRPVVASQRGGLPEIVAHGETGYNIDVYNTALFAKRIKDLLVNGDLRGEFGRKGRRRVRERFEMSLIAEQVRDVYENHNGQ